MSKDVTIIFSAVVVSWVLFVFNFVLGYYMGRWVEAADQITAKKKKKKEKKIEQKNPQQPAYY